MNLSRRSVLKAAFGIPTAGSLLTYRALAAPHTGQVKITQIETMVLDNVGDGCLIRIETDAVWFAYCARWEQRDTESVRLLKPALLIKRASSPRNSQT